MRPDQDVIPRSKLPFRFPLELQTRSTPQYDDPLRMVLIIPEARGRAVAPRTDSLHPVSLSLEQVVENFLIGVIRQCLKNIACGMFRRNHLLTASSGGG